MRVLVVRLGAFGDILHTLPLAADLARAGHTVGWLCEDRWASVISGSAAVARVHQLPRQGIRAPTPLSGRLHALSGCVRQLRAAEYDLVIDAQGLAKSAFFAAACGAARRIGHALPTAREGSWLVSRERVATTHAQVIRQQRDLATALGIPIEGPPRFLLPSWEEERHWARTQLALLNLHRPWLLNVGAGWPTKIWPQGHQIELVRMLKERRLEVLILWGSPGEQRAAQAVQAAAGYGTLAPSSTIAQLGGLIAHARVLISGDTGPLHLAFALGTPAVGLFGPVPARRNGPYGNGYRSLQAPAAPWERHDLSKVDMGAITPAMVLAAAEDCLEERSRAASGA